MIFVNLLRCKT